MSITTLALALALILIPSYSYIIINPSLYNKLDHDIEFFLRYIFSGAEVFPDDLSDNDSDEDDDEVGVYIFNE